MFGSRLARESGVGLCSCGRICYWTLQGVWWVVESVVGGDGGVGGLLRCVRVGGGWEGGERERTEGLKSKESDLSVGSRLSRAL